MCEWFKSYTGDLTLFTNDVGSMEVVLGMLANLPRVLGNIVKVG